MNIPDAWYDALTLGERLALPSGAGHDAAQGQHRVQRWRARPGFSGSDLFDRRLAAAGMTADDLARLLGQSSKALRELAGTPPSWMEDLAHGLESDVGMAASSDDPHAALSLALLGPLVARASARLGQAAEALGFAPHETLCILLPALVHALVPKVQRTLVLEWHIWKEQVGVDASLADFERVLTQPLKQRALFEEYPVLARQCLQHISFWQEANLEFLERLRTDRDALIQVFAAGQDPGPLTGMEVSAGDTHGRGRRVMVVSFANGLRVVYKPRSLSIDHHLQQLIGFLHGRGLQPDLKTPRVLDRSAYGWVEFIGQEPCQSLEEVERFYQRLGCWLALTYILGATDLHAENVIANGPHPILVDLETLFHPRLEDIPGNTADAFARRLLNDSVWSTGLLPDPALDDALDVSGLGAASAQLGPVAVPVVSTDGGSLRVERVRPVLNSFKNRPVLDGMAAEPGAWSDAVEAGFSRTYGLLSIIGDELPLQPFHRDSLRVLVRGTARYGQILMESWHPNLLRHGLAREQYFDHLWSDVKDVAWLSRCLGSEVAQLLDGDIPLFTTTPLSLDVHGADGTDIHRLAMETGLQVAQGRLQRMGAVDHEFQFRMVRMSLFALQQGQVSRHEAAPQSVGSGEMGETAVLSALALACRVGDALVATAIRRDGTCTWITGELGTFGPAGPDLYTGLSGIILFLAYLDSLAPDVTATYRSVAEEALAQLQQLPAPEGLGAFSGLSGQVYLWLHLGTLWHRPDLLQRAADAVQSMPLGDPAWDVVDGLAGVMACLLALHHVSPHAGGLAAATTLGEHALQQATVSEAGMNWSELPRQRGFSHGTSGLAWVLWRLGDVTQDPRFHTAASEAFRYEEALIESSGWFDAERTDAGSWCHGPPGMALARLHSGRETVSSLTKTAESPALNHPGLCHGELGNLETLIVASQCELAGGTCQAALQSRSKAVLRRTDLLDTRRDPGLMTGLAGIGYGLLRLHAPDRIPSVLTLEPPPGGYPGSRPRGIGQ